MNETLKDILFMAWAFIGGGMAFFLFLNLDLGYVTTGSVVKIGTVLNEYFYFIGLGFIGLLFLVLIIRGIVRRIKRKNKKPKGI